MNNLTREKALLALKGDAAVIAMANANTGELVDTWLVQPDDDHDIAFHDAGHSVDLSKRLNAPIECIGRLSTEQLKELAQGGI